MGAVLMDILEEAWKTLEAFGTFIAIAAISTALLPCWIFGWPEILRWMTAGSSLEMDTFFNLDASDAEAA